MASRCGQVNVPKGVGQQPLAVDIFIMHNTYQGLWFQSVSQKYILLL